MIGVQGEGGGGHYLIFVFLVSMHVVGFMVFMFLFVLTCLFSIVYHYEDIRQ